MPSSAGEKPASIISFSPLAVSCSVRLGAHHAVAHHGVLELLVELLAVDLAVLHDEVLVDAQDRQHFQLLVVQEGVALRHDVASRAQDALAEGLGVERADLAEGGGGHERDVAKLGAVGVLGNDLEVERAHVEAHQVGDEVERLVLGQVRVLVAPWLNGLPIALAPASPPTSFTSLMKTSNRRARPWTAACAGGAARRAPSLRQPWPPAGASCPSSTGRQRRPCSRAAGRRCTTAAARRATSRSA
mmetsp:Transcript_29437/g.87015  ORF Transcript_29437/g.87015 Transcript_29437/m.87015 type:complete len:245 (-) Transcript_29437:472-1206(-)